MMAKSHKDAHIGKAGGLVKPQGEAPSGSYMQYYEALHACWLAIATYNSTPACPKAITEDTRRCWQALMERWYPDLVNGWLQDPVVGSFMPDTSSSLLQQTQLSAAALKSHLKALLPLGWYHHQWNYGIVTVTFTETFRTLCQLP